MEENPTYTCLACGNSKELCFGYVGGAANVFIPSNMFTIHGFRTRAFICLRCGYIWQYLPLDRLEKLREKYKEMFDKAVEIEPLAP